MSLFVITGVILSDNSVMFICRLVEEVKDACSVTLETDDIYMNTRYCFHWHFLHKIVIFCFLPRYWDQRTPTCMPWWKCSCLSNFFIMKTWHWKISVPFVVFGSRYGDFVRLAVLHSRGGGHQEFTCNTVSTLKTKTLALKVKNYATYWFWSEVCMWRMLLNAHLRFPHQTIK